MCKERLGILKIGSGIGHVKTDYVKIGSGIGHVKLITLKIGSRTECIIWPRYENTCAGRKGHAYYASIRVCTHALP